jgi:malonyl-CoA decarboxylase
VTPGTDPLPRPRIHVRCVGADEARLLADLAARERVHPVAGPQDLADRLDADRRVMVLEDAEGGVLTVVWVALMDEVPGRIAQVLDPVAPCLPAEDARVAVFYSIWNVADRVPRGGARSLIERAGTQLREELPQLSTMVTLSPAPQLATVLPNADPGDDGFAAAVATALVARDDRGRLREPVARFHLGNGARLWRVNLDADGSARAREQAYGVMVNYRYEPEDRAANRAVLAGGEVAVSPAVRALLDGRPPAD